MIFWTKNYDLLFLWIKAKMLLMLFGKIFLLSVKESAYRLRLERGFVIAFFISYFLISLSVFLLLSDFLYSVTS